MEQQQLELLKENLPAIATDMTGWGPAPQLSAQDIKLPVLMLTQAMSDAAKQKKAKEGDFFDTSSERVIGNIEKGVEIIPIVGEIVWHIFHYDKKAKKYIWHSKTPLDTDASSPTYNDKWKYEEIVKIENIPTEVKRERRIEFFVLVPSGDSALPYHLTFKVTSIKAGKQLMTQVYMENLNAGLVPPARAFTLAGHSESNDKGSFVVMDIRPSRNSSDKEMKDAFKWFKLIKSGQAKVDVVDDEAIPRAESGEETGEF